MSLSFISFVNAGFYWGSFGKRHNILPNRKSINSTKTSRSRMQSKLLFNNDANNVVVAFFQSSVAFATLR